MSGAAATTDRSTVIATDDDRRVDGDLRAAIAAAVAGVCDPEYPDLSIVDLGLLERIDVVRADGAVVARIGLIPTFSGCPALDMIADDVRDAVVCLAGIDRCEVIWLAGPVWSIARVSDAGRRALAASTVVLRGRDGRLRCPVCGSSDVIDSSLAGPTRCRSVAWCSSCRNPIEVMR